jgi:hypothetical protein
MLHMEMLPEDKRFIAVAWIIALIALGLISCAMFELFDLIFS